MEMPRNYNPKMLFGKDNPKRLIDFNPEELTKVLGALANTHALLSAQIPLYVVLADRAKVLWFHKTAAFYQAWLLKFLFTLQLREEAAKKNKPLELVYSDYVHQQKFRKEVNQI